VELVTDANVWRDLHVGQVLASAFELKATFVVTDLMFAELYIPPGSMLQTWGLQIVSLNGEELEEVVELGSRYPRPSRQDLSGLFLAQRRNALLLTGDGALRAAAENEEVEVHGTLWVMDQLVDSEIIASREGARALQLMADHPKRRLPMKELQKRVRKWR